MVISIFESADNGGRCADHFGKLSLSKACAFAKSMNLPRNRIVSLSLRQLGEPLRPPFIVPPMNDLDRVGRRPLLLPSFHNVLFN